MRALFIIGISIVAFSPVSGQDINFDYVRVGISEKEFKEFIETDLRESYSDQDWKPIEKRKSTDIVGYFYTLWVRDRPQDPADVYEYISLNDTIRYINFKPSSYKSFTNLLGPKYSHGNEDNMYDISDSYSLTLKAGLLGTEYHITEKVN